MTEIALCKIRDITAELHDQRIVETVHLTELLAHLRGRVDRQIEVGRIARQPGEEEHDDDKHHERYATGDRAFADETLHATPPE
ncbi:hypothetical protein U8P73_26560 (plasmid) [Rhizobium beringeri]|uniref:hypothetical protein n=1 Tax=Rhizobium beringeri TaxID=3019934 RepID=UPI002DDD6D5E|nr:hypothetical protein [Rhizobium beringeri]WSG92251.1 hypothetical protein U8P73_26560 [Rhizobium beringeri]